MREERVSEEERITRTEASLRAQGWTTKQIEDYARDIAEKSFIADRLRYEEDCFNWKPIVPPQGEGWRAAFPKPPSLSPPLAQRMEGSRFDDRYYLNCAFENFKLAIEHIQKLRGMGYYLDDPVRPQPLSGKPIGRPRGLYSYREILKQGLTLQQSSVVMKTAQESGLTPAQVIRELIEEYLGVGPSPSVEEPAERGEEVKIEITSLMTKKEIKERLALINPSKKVGRPRSEYTYREVLREGLTLAQSNALMQEAQRVSKDPATVLRDLIDEHLVNG